MNKRHLHILWTNDNMLTAEHMVLMYSKAALSKKWWDKVTIIIWGATAKLVSENNHIQELIKEAKIEGVEFSACVACATNLDSVEALKELGVELKYWGDPLTNLIKNNEHFLTI